MCPLADRALAPATIHPVEILRAHAARSLSRWSDHAARSSASACLDSNPDPIDYAATTARCSPHASPLGTTVPPRARQARGVRSASAHTNRPLAAAPTPASHHEPTDPCHRRRRGRSCRLRSHRSNRRRRFIRCRSRTHARPRTRIRRRIEAAGCGSPSCWRGRCSQGLPSLLPLLLTAAAAVSSGRLQALHRADRDHLPRPDGGHAGTRLEGESRQGAYDHQGERSTPRHALPRGFSLDFFESHSWTSLAVVLSVPAFL